MGNYFFNKKKGGKKKREKKKHVLGVTLLSDSPVVALVGSTDATHPRWCVSTPVKAAAKKLNFRGDSNCVMRMKSKVSKVVKTDTYVYVIFIFCFGIHLTDQGVQFATKIRLDRATQL